VISPPNIQIPTRPIAPGTYWIGAGADDKFADASERPRRAVKLTCPLAFAVFPVTESEFAAFRDFGPLSDLPVVHVSWEDATAYAQWLAARTGLPWRLPTEAEWEIACRAGSHTIFAPGNTLTTSQANFLYDESGNRIGLGHRTPRGTYPPNAFGLEDMHGNVCEWCADPWLTPSSQNPPSAPDRVIRGGAWDHLPRLLRSSWRDHAPPSTRRDNLGFRLVHTLTPSP
jgi:formylglycine-generating enzyme required for sulfatase activity